MSSHSNPSEILAQCDETDAKEEEEEEVCILEAPTKDVSGVRKDDIYIVDEPEEDASAPEDQPDDPLSLCDVTGVKVEEDICIVEEPIEDEDPGTTTTTTSTKPWVGGIK